MNFFEMLMLSKRLKFEDGKVEFYGQNVLIIPTISMARYLVEVNKSDELAGMLYSNARDAVLENKREIAKAYDSADAKAWLEHTLNIYSQGRVHFDKLSEDLTGTLVLEDSCIADGTEGKADNAADHILRGIIAGVVSSLSGCDMDAIELSCRAKGDNECRLVISKREDLRRALPDLYARQVGDVRT